MRMKTTAVLAATAAALGTGLVPTTAHAQADRDHRDGTRSLAQVLAADGHHFDHNWSDFDVLDKVVTTVLAAKPHSPVAVLADGRQRLTAFLPTDRAFRKLAWSVTGRRPATERGTFRVLAHTFDANTLETVLLYHVVPGRTLTANRVVRADGKRLTTAQGGTITVHVRRHGVHLADRDPDARNPMVKSDEVNINQGNRQVAHGIDRVLRPVDL